MTIGIAFSRDVEEVRMFKAWLSDFPSSLVGTEQPYHNTATGMQTAAILPSKLITTLLNSLSMLTFSLTQCQVRKV